MRESSWIVAARMSIILIVLASLPGWAVWKARQRVGGTGPTRLSATTAAKNNSRPSPARPRGELGKAGPADGNVVPQIAGSIKAATAGCRTDAESSELHAVQDRLKQLGVDYMLLEALDQPGQRAYRFRGYVPLPTNPVYQRQFEAVAASPLEAMQRVLRRVETWTVARHAPGDDTVVR